MKIIITEKEVENTKEILRDPCEHIECAGLSCDHCPFREYAQSLREAQDKFIDMLDSIPTKGAE